jgi:hypothetical protein
MTPEENTVTQNNLVVIFKVKVLFYSCFPISERTLVEADSKTSPVCPSESTPVGGDEYGTFVE